MPALLLQKLLNLIKYLRYEDLIKTLIITRENGSENDFLRLY